ncbi:outer membrane usher protein fimD [Bifidobacterium boum]|uniref:Outer membrane usher protein fimD n=1 Tax=Bifidobacterium boum TaxID=78343 RepID=A0A086ZRZ9_9BIFI|nr:outer membrane usher protein fimD [Bifidobacterium boum]
MISPHALACSVCRRISCGRSPKVWKLRVQLIWLRGADRTAAPPAAATRTRIPRYAQAVRSNRSNCVEKDAPRHSETAESPQNRSGTHPSPQTVYGNVVLSVTSL